MIKKLISLLVISSISSACVAQSTCKNSPGTGYSISSRIKKTDEKRLVWDIPEESKLNATYGIANLNFYKVPTSKIPYLDIVVLGKAKSIEYEANVDNILEEKVYDARPGSTIIGTTILLGLPLLFFPGKTFDNAFGCTEEISSKLTPSQTDRVPTGNEQWVDYSPSSVRLQITTSDSPPLEQDLKVTNGTATVRLEDYINLKNAKGQVNIKVLCLTCKNLNNDNLGLSYSDQKEIVLDVSQIRAIESANKKKLDDAAMVAKQKAEEDRLRAADERQKVADRAAQAKLDAAAKAQAAEQKILDQYKEKCSNLGFKVGTDAFGKCVLQLTK